MKPVARPACAPLLLLALACASEGGHETPGPDTLPSVRVPYPDFYLEEDPTLEPVTFGEASLDLPVTIVGLDEGGRDHVIDFGLPEQATMQGYGAFEGMTESYHRTRLRDVHGIHGVRVAVYRTDTKRGHTNVWTHFLARAETGDLFLTEQAQWDWIGGEEDTTGFSRGAWPFFRDIQISHYRTGGFFGYTPGIYDRSDYITQVILATNAVSPTYKLQGCVQVLFNSVNPSLRHQAFLHERYGLVEMVYDWYDLDSVNPDGNDYPLVPLDGFAADPATLEELPAPPTTSNDLAGSWHGEAELQTAQGDLVTRTVHLELTPVGLAYRALSDSYDVEGTYTEGDLEFHVRGRFYRSTQRLMLVAGRTADLIEIEGYHSRSLGSSGGIDLGIYHAGADDQAVAGGALLLRGSSTPDAFPGIPTP